MTARERIAALIDPGTPFLEIGLLLAYDQYDGEAPGLGSVTGIGKIEGRHAVIIAGDATVKAGSWWPETVTKGLRAQEIAMRNRIPIVYLVDSAGVNLPYQDRIFPGQYGGGRIFYYNSLMRRKLRVPQIAAVMGPCIAGGAYLPALSDYIIMVEGTSFMGLGGPNLVKGATGQVVDSESIGGARMHTTVSGVAHYMAKDDAECLARIRQRFRDLPAPPAPAARPMPPARPTDDIYGVLPENHRLPYDIEEVIFRIFDAGDYTEFQPEYAPEMLCANARLSGHPVAIIANRRGFLRAEGRPRIGGIVYTESARKVAYFVELNERAGLPADLFAGRFRIHGGARSRTRGHHPGRRRHGGGHVLHQRAEDHPDAQSRQRRGLLRHGGPGLRAEFHVQLAHRAHRRDGRRFRRAGAVLGGTGKIKAAGEPLPQATAGSPSRKPRPTTKAGWMRATPLREAIATPSSIRWTRGRC